MMNLSNVSKILVTILVVVMAVALLGCASTGSETESGSSSSGEEETYDECVDNCESLSGEEKAGCIERCAQIHFR